MSETSSLSSLHKAVEHDRRVLHVGGICSFEAERWREAVLCHIHRVWERHDTRPFIDLGGVTIEFDPAKDVYHVFGTPSFIAAPIPETAASQPLVVDPPSGAAIRDALGRFARDKTLRGVTVYFKSGVLELWKTPGSELLGVAAAGIAPARSIAPSAPLVAQPPPGFVPAATAINAVLRRTTSSQQIPAA